MKRVAVVLSLGFCVVSALVGAVVWEVRRDSGDGASLEAERRQDEAQLARAAQRFSNVDLTPGMTLGELKTAFQDPEATARPTGTRDEAVAQFLKGAVKTLFYSPACQGRSSSLDCDAAQTTAISVKRPFAGTVLGLRIDDVAPQTIRTVLQPRVHSLERRGDGGWDVFLFALPRRHELGHWALRVNAPGNKLELGGVITLTDERYVVSFKFQ